MMVASFSLIGEGKTWKEKENRSHVMRDPAAICGLLPAFSGKGKAKHLKVSHMPVRGPHTVAEQASVFIKRAWATESCQRDNIFLLVVEKLWNDPLTFHWSMCSLSSLDY